MPPPPADTDSRPLLLTEPAIELLGSLWGEELLDGSQPLSYRQVRWGTGARPMRFAQPARAVDGAQLTTRMRERLATRDRPTDTPAWTVTAAAVGGEAEYRQARRRRLLAGTAPPRREHDGTTAWLDCTELGWLHLTPLGHSDCLAQAMVSRDQPPTRPDCWRRC
ncbi:hypothetical protein ACQEV2_00280 [Streptomyces sp. CA-251387]|uniref:hypothetical protein n=1 Tax=Streptomyces sp. CA-251387 TaxID=3240064 RepID=UPI003D90A62D